MSQVTWPVVVKHAQKQIDECRDALETAPSETVIKIQARVAVWRQILSLPETLKADAEESDRAGYN